MSDATRFADVHSKPGRPTTSTLLFKATVGQFDAPSDRILFDELTNWVESRYQEDLKLRPSKHVYLRTLPDEVVAKMDRLRDSPVILDRIVRAFDPGWVITPMKHTDELYISHYNKDYGGDHGLFSKHYDGNLRFLPVGTVVRALIYLQSDATYKVVFEDSGVAHPFVTYEFGLLDFHREMHWVEGEYNPHDKQRIMLKCNYLVAPRNAAWLTKGLLAANTGVFYAVKAAMEYSKSPKNPVQFVIGMLCNIARLLNNVHPLLPLALLALVIGAAGWGIAGLL